MRKGDGLDEILVEAKHARQRATDLSHFQAVGQPCAVVIAFVINEDLGLVDEPAEGRRMDDAVAVALIDIAGGAGRLVVKAAAALFRMRSVGCNSAMRSSPSA